MSKPLIIFLQDFLISSCRIKFSILVRTGQQAFVNECLVRQGDRVKWRNRN